MELQMGAFGRTGRVKPLELKLLSGSKADLNLETPQFSEMTDIYCPEWIDGYARALWEVLAPQLCANKVLRMTDIQNLEMYCVAYGRWREAEAEVRNEGLTITGAMGGKIKNPAVTVINEAMRQMISIGANLGLDPSSRQRLRAPAPDPGKNRFAAVLAGPSKTAAAVNHA